MQSKRKKPMLWVVLLLLLLAGGLLWIRSRKGSVNLEEAFRRTEDLLQEGRADEALESLAPLRGRRLRGEALDRYRALRAEVLERKGNLEEADALRKRLVREAAPAFQSAAIIALAEGDWKRSDAAGASRWIDRLLKEFPEAEETPRALLLQARLAAASDPPDLRAARRLLNDQIERFPDSPVIEEAVRLLGEINMRLLFSPLVTEGSTAYQVMPGDSLASIAKRFNTTVALLRESNGIRGGVIHPNDRLKVVTAPFSLLVDKSSNTLTLKTALAGREEILRVYPIGTGKHNMTPVGEFVIGEKLAEPVWYHPDGKVFPYGDKENLLGTRWVGIYNEKHPKGYGIHGTWEPESVGKQSSAGCIRMLNRDVEELFRILTPGTQVTITD